jgi:hypothetical protein
MIKKFTTAISTAIGSYIAYKMYVAVMATLATLPKL